MFTTWLRRRFRHSRSGAGTGPHLAQSHLRSSWLICVHLRLFFLTAESGDPFVAGKENLTQMNADKQG
jgi:hypothetical protein